MIEEKKRQKKAQILEKLRMGGAPRPATVMGFEVDEEIPEEEVDPAGGVDAGMELTNLPNGNLRRRKKKPVGPLRGTEPVE